MRHAILGAIVLDCASASLARAQAFADLKTAAVDYSKSEPDTDHAVREPREVHEP